MIQKRLFAVSDSPSIQAALTTPEAILAAIQAAGSLNIGAIVRLHWYDPDAATAWLNYARSDRFSRETINTLPSLEQNARVVEMWDAFGRYWRCLNVSPYGWARFRRLCEAQWGYPSYSLGQDGWSGKINTPQRNGQYGGMWRRRAHAAIYTPAVAASQVASYSPRFGVHRAQFVTGNGNPEFGPTDVVFGTRDPYAIENAGSRASERGVLPNRGFAPTVEVHRVWMQRTGELIGSYPSGLDRTYADANPGAPWGRTLAEAWRGYNFSEPPANNPGRWDDWTIGFALPQAATAGGTDTQWTVPPLLWYWELLRGVQSLPTGYGDSPTYPNEPASPTPSMSVLDYLASKTPDAIVREVMNDVQWRNRAMATNTGVVLSALGDEAGRRELDRQREAQTPSLAAQIVAGTATAIGGVVSLATANPLGLGMAGMVSQAVRLVDSLSRGTAEERRTDVFGRLMPTLDTVGIVDDSSGARLSITEAGTPSGGGGLTISIPLFINIGANADALGTGPLSIVGMPHGGQVEVGQARDVPACRWTDDTLTTWRCTIPTGPQWVRVVSAEGEARLGRTETSSIAPASLTWASMFREHRYGITGLPQGTAVFVDGAPAMGTWTDASMGEWQVFMPTGSHDVRLVAPGMAPVLVTVRAEGDASRATWGALQTASVQQRQTAAGGSSVGLIVAGVVGVGALAIFLATVVMDGKPAPKRNPSRR